MPSTLHPHLKRRLYFDDTHHVNPADVVEKTPSESIGAEEKAAKRQRVEKIALQYLQGKRPVILSAGLRGPFNHDWNNPWVETKQKKRSNASKESSADSRRTRSKGRDAVRGTKCTNGKKRIRSAPRKTSEEHMIASPGGPGAIEEDVKQLHESRTLNEVKFEPPTATMSEGPDTTGRSEFLSIDTNQCLRDRSPQTNSAWLQRPGYEKQFDTVASPTLLRDASLRLKTTQKLQRAAPKTFVGLRVPLISATAPDDVGSSASACMVLSSPSNPSILSKNRNVRLRTPLRQEGTVSHMEAPELTLEAQPTQVQIDAALACTFIPLTVSRIPQAKTLFPNVAATPKHDYEAGILQHSSKEPPKKDILRSPERLVDIMSSSCSSQSQTEQCNRKNAKEVGQRSLPHQQSVPSQLLSSSNGFVYKKIRSSKWTISNAPRSKPRAVNFNSSPTINPDTKRPSKPRSQNTDIGVEGSEPTEAAEGQINEIIQEQQSLGSSHAGRQSVISTQAAMLLAQREFQESSYQSSPNRTPGPWSQSQERTSQTMLPEPSPAITPISVFRPRLGQPYSFSSMHQDPPISTQDLFAAASPFAFSTIKKRAEKPQPNSLEVAMKSFDKLYQNGLDAGLNSPIASAKRIPLKKKNTSENTWNLGFDKGVWSSQESFKGNAGRSGDDVRSSQPEFDTGLDGHGHESSPQFADRLLATKTMVK